METKVFEGGTVKEMLQQCLSEGYKPMNLKQAWEWKQQQKKFEGWIDTATIFMEGAIRDATLEELKNIEEVYKEGRRLLFLGGFCNYSLSGNGSLGDSGRFVGVKKWKKTR